MKWNRLSVITLGCIMSASLLMSGCKTSASVVKLEGRIQHSFNQNWHFAKGSNDQAMQINLDDSQWQAVNLPHDWAIAGPFNPQDHGYAAKLPWKSSGWYRKSFTLDKADIGKQVYLDFDGVMAFPKVYVNGQLAGQWDYGYMSFRVDATPFVKFGEENLVAVEADASKHDTRWYPGAGIYRKVTLTICDPVHVGHWNTFITTPSIDDKVAIVLIRSSIDNHSKTDAKVNISFVLLDPKGNIAAKTSMEKQVVPGKLNELEQTFTVNHPQRWDVTSPNLYTAKITIERNGKIVDTDISTFGIRTFEFTANDGFHLNGRRVQLYGVCLHHDQGPLGGAFYPRAMQRQLEIMRDMGVNAIRTSHNPPAPELLELCDKMGFVVWDECFDKWDSKADRINGQPPLEEYGDKQIRNLVMRDRNHPSIIVWSIANEIGARSARDESGLTPERVKFMREFVLKYDATRPVGMACHIPQLANSQIPAALDLTGWNYNRRYEIMREQYPEKPIIYSESASALSTRGFYQLPLPEKKTSYASEQFQVDSYDHNAANWSDIPDREFELMQQDKFVAGEFVWTGFDYLGEPTPFDKDAVSSYFGIVDLCGIPKDRFYLYRSYWRPDTTTVHILPHWNWPDQVGKPVPVYVYTNGDSAELFLNGKSLGKKTKISPDTRIDLKKDPYYAVLDKYRLRWLDVTYQTGELKAVAYKNGKKIGEAVMQTANAPAAVRLTADRTKLTASGEDLSYILVEAIDGQGIPCPLADNLIQFRVGGPADIAGVGNGNPMSQEPFQADYRKLFYGKAMLIIRTKAGETGKITVEALSDGLKTAECKLQSK